MIKNTIFSGILELTPINLNWRFLITKQITITESLATSSTGVNKNQKFNFDLWKALIRANISFNKLSNEDLKSFLESCCNRRVPNESTLCKNYVCLLYKEMIGKIKCIIGHKKIFLKAPLRVQVFEEKLPNFALPP